MCGASDRREFACPPACQPAEPKEAGQHHCPGRWLGDRGRGVEGETGRDGVLIPGMKGKAAVSALAFAVGCTRSQKRYELGDEQTVPDVELVKLPVQHGSVTSVKPKAAGLWLASSSAS